MPFKIAISSVAKIIYKNQYEFLRQKLLLTYIELAGTKIARNDILEKLLISAEDHRFKYHIGFDVLAILRAFRNNFFYNKNEGASTIEQQIVRVLTNDFEKTAKRKIKEIFLATTLSKIVPRQEIPLIYLHIAYYGSNMTGLQGVYDRFQLPQDIVITDDIAAEIIARIKYPEPKILSEKRANQINIRKKHILWLYSNHKKRTIIKIY